MKFKLSNCKSDTSYITLLSNITFKYVNDYWNGETFYAEYSLDNEKGNLVELFINELTLIPIIINKKNTIILNLLVNPLFNELCDYLSSKPKISKSKIRLIKKYIFSYLGSELKKIQNDNIHVIGSDIYRNQNMYERSKEMLKILEDNY